MSLAKVLDKLSLNEDKPGVTYKKINYDRIPKQRRQFHGQRHPGVMMQAGIRQHTGEDGKPHFHIERYKDKDGKIRHRTVPTLVHRYIPWPVFKATVNEQKYKARQKARKGIIGRAKEAVGL